MSTSTVLSFDLSKSSTGFCFSNSTYSPTTQSWGINVTMSGRLTSPPAASLPYTYKHLHSSLKGIQAGIRKALVEWAKVLGSRPSGHTSVTIEHPIFQGTSSPLQFYLHQSMLAFFDEMDLSVVSYSTGFLKSFLSSLDGSTSSMKEMDKKFLGALYRKEYGISIPLGYKSPDLVGSSDELDAIILNMAGVTCQARVLGSLPSLLPNVLDMGEKLLKRPDIYRSIFLSQEGCLPVDGLGKGKPFYAGITKKLKANKFLSLGETKMFYPYEALRFASQYLTALRDGSTDRKTLYSEVSQFIGFNNDSKQRFLTGTEPLSVYSSFEKGFFIETPYSLKDI